jgi:hypothetical protein
MASIPLPHEIKGEHIPFERLTPDDWRLISALTDRTVKTVVDCLKRLGRTDYDEVIDRDSLRIMMDLASAKLSRNLDLFRFLMANDLDFMDEWIVIQKTVDRACGRIPDDVKLRFAQSGAILEIIH